MKQKEMFQFLIGRLKNTFLDKANPNTNYGFQFLIGRLKNHIVFLGLSTITSGVSIPYR